MGMYTEVIIKVKLIEDTPEWLVIILDKCINHTEELYKELGSDWGKISTVSQTPNLPIEHEFGQCSRWSLFFHSNNFDPITIEGSSFDKETKILSIHTEFKNYSQEIEKFLDMIEPYIDKLEDCRTSWEGQEWEELLPYYKRTKLDE